MLHRIFVALAAVVVFTSSVRADVEGEITAKDAKSITVKTADGKEVKINVTDDTAIEGPRGKIDLEKLAVGRKVKIDMVKDKEDTAAKITVQAGPNKLGPAQIQVNPNNVKRIPAGNIKVAPRVVPGAPVEKEVPADKAVPVEKEVPADRAVPVEKEIK